MKQLLLIALFSSLSGITVLLGGVIAWRERFPDSEAKRIVLHAVTAFGGGTLIAAVAFVLAPKGVEELSAALLTALFLAGAVVFLILDHALDKRGGFLAQLLAMLMDYVPEAIALGAVFAHDVRMGLLLALYIGLQNLPESFNAYGDLRRSGLSEGRALLVLAPLSLVGILAALAGNLFLSDQPQLVAGLMTFAAGGIVYLTFQDIAPLAKMEKHWSPALGASLGFALGMLGQKLLGG